ncbi:dTDP-4-amino-4,6-dideoxygalactose transaminase [Pycnococcus provasolii]
MSNNLCVNRLDFDSRVLGIETARILSEAPITTEQVDETLQACSRDGIGQVYEKCGGLCVEAEYDFHFWTTLEPFDDPKSSDIPNCKPFLVGHELDNIKDMFSSRSIATHAKYGPLCQEFLEKELGAMKVLLVCSGTAGLEVSSLCCDIHEGDEVIVPSYTFVSTANAFVLHGATPVFVDIRSDTQNIDETKIEAAITEKTKAIAVVHYAGVPCEMDAIMDIAERRNLIVVEDNAHGVFSSYKGRKLGTIGHLGVLSFHYTKNIVCGEGGAVIINRPEMLSRAMIAWEKGTNRFDFLSGKVDRYAWVDRGSSFILSELQSAVLYAQLCNWQQIIERRLFVWNTYHALLELSERTGRLRRPIIPDGCAHNAHIYYVRIPDPTQFSRVAELAKERRVGIFTHYVPLHSSTGGSKYGRASDSLLEVNLCYAQLYRLPMWVGIISTLGGGLTATEELTKHHDPSDVETQHEMAAEGGGITTTSTTSNDINVGHEHYMINDTQWKVIDSILGPHNLNGTSADDGSNILKDANYSCHGS